MVVGRKMRELGIKGVIINMVFIFSFLVLFGIYVYYVMKGVVVMMMKLVVLDFVKYSICVVVVVLGFVDMFII